MIKVVRINKRIDTAKAGEKVKKIKRCNQKFVLGKTTFSWLITCYFYFRFLVYFLMYNFLKVSFF